MNLLYVWNKAYSRGNGGYLLSSRYEIKFDRPSCQLSIRRNENAFTDEFWGEHIYDVMAVAGRNGSGKTRLAYLIMDTLHTLGTLLDKSIEQEKKLNFPETTVELLLVFEDGSGIGANIRIFTTVPGLSKESISQRNLDPSLWYDWNLRWSDLNRFKFAYFTDVLSLEDYRYEKYGVVYDGSLGGRIQKDYKYNLEMHYTNSQRNPIINYYDEEMKEILCFLCYDHNQEGIPFVLPKQVTFSLTDFTVNLDYILDELERMGMADEKNILKRKCDEIRERYGWNMCSGLSVHLMLNLFKASCIPQSSADHLEHIAKIFLQKIEHLGCGQEDVYDMLLELLDAVRRDADPHIIKSYEDMIRWLKEEFDFQENRWKSTWILDLKEEFDKIKRLYDHYRETNFPYPYFSISFGLSTGEYAFLRRFVQVNRLLCPDSRGEGHVMNNIGYETQCDGLMLYFDEADHSMHPEWQRKYLDWLLQFVSARFKTCNVQLVIATHSPVMLSDIPRGHVMYLQNNGKEIQAQKRNIHTFGSNIHDLFRDAFFMEEGTMGAFAERKINETAHELQVSGGQSSQVMQRIIEETGDDVIRGKLQQMCRNGRPRETVQTEDRMIGETIRLLKSQVIRLENTIRELERMRDDKD